MQSIRIEKAGFYYKLTIVEDQVLKYERSFPYKNKLKMLHSNG